MCISELLLQTSKSELKINIYLCCDVLKIKRTITLDLQPRDKAAMLDDETIQFFLQNLHEKIV